MKRSGLFLLAVTAAAIIASCGGDANKEDKPPFSASEGTAPAAPNGEAIYKRSCVSCHMAGGEGIDNVYPPLAKSDYLADRARAIHQVIKGSSGEIIVNGKKYNNTMPPQQLNDEEIAAVLTYVYTSASLGNNGSAVTVDEVKAVRAKQ